MISVKQGTRTLDGVPQVTVGSGPEAGFFVNDSVMAAVHFAVQQVAGGGFAVRDLGTVSGTYVGGEAITERVLADGDEIVAGVTVIRVKLTGEGNQAKLALTVRPNTFAYDRPKEGVFDSDPDRWVQSEQHLSRFPLLTTSNRVAVVASLVGLLAVILVTSLFEGLSDPGPLTAAHANLFAANDDPDLAEAAGVPGLAAARQLVEDQSCNVCHEGGGTPQRLCMVCHDYLSDTETRRHPFHQGATLETLPGIEVDQQFCVLCHTDHEAPEDLKAGSEALTGDCAACHGVGVEGLALPPVPDVATPPTAYSTVRFPHDVHLQAAIDCAICHEVDGTTTRLAAAGLDDPASHDFAEVPYETCAECHVATTEPRAAIADRREDWIDKAPQWTVGWHGSEDGEATCGQCHTSDEGFGYGPDFVTVERARGRHPSGTRGIYELERRSHQEVFAAHAEGRACIECHRAGEDLGTEERPVAAFWHGLHLPQSALAGKADAQCLTCHEDLQRSRELIEAPNWWRADDGPSQQACATCHFEMEGDGRRATELLPVTSDPRNGDIETLANDRVVQFPHEFHTQLEGGCATCHGFEPAAGQDAPYAVVATTNFAAADCRQCHASHDNVAGGDCQQCHPGADNPAAAPVAAGTRPLDVYWLAAGRTADPRAGAAGSATLAAPLRAWPEANRFSHLSRGHEKLDCAECHTEASLAVDTLGQVAGPAESQQLCRDCHLEKQFHWR